MHLFFFLVNLCNKHNIFYKPTMANKGYIRRYHLKLTGLFIFCLTADSEAFGLYIEVWFRHFERNFHKILLLTVLPFVCWSVLNMGLNKYEWMKFAKLFFCFSPFFFSGSGLVFRSGHVQMKLCIYLMNIRFVKFLTRALFIFKWQVNTSWKTFSVIPCLPILL